jgi:hypothetical protein
VSSPALLPAAVLIIGGLSLTAGAFTADPTWLRARLMRSQLWFLEAQFLLFLVSTAMNLRDLVRFLELGRPVLKAVAGVSLLMLVLVLLVAPRTNRIYFDEHIYQAVAQSLSDTHVAQICNDGRVEYGILSCERGEYNKEPHGYPYLLSVVYRFAGVSEPVAHALNATLAALLVWVIFFTACLLFADAWAGVWAALIVTLIPQQLLWSHTAAAEPSAALMAATAILATMFYVRRQTGTSLLWAVSAVAFALQFRVEVGLIVPVVLLAVVLYAPRELARPRLWWGACLGLALGAAHVAHLAAIRDESWGSSGDRLALAHFWPNLAVNGWFYLTDARFPAAFTFIALIGLVRKPDRSVLIAASLFLLFWGIFLFFYAGSYNFGADVRFSLMTYPWLALLAGRGVSLLLSTTQVVAARDGAARVVAASVLALIFSWYLPQVRAVGDEAWAARADIEFVHRVMPTLPENSVVLTHTPSVFLLNGVNAAQMSLVMSEPAYVTGQLSSRHAGGVFLHWNAWCGYLDLEQQAFCHGALKSFSSELFIEHRERDFRYAFYRLQTEGTIQKVEQ